MSNLFEMSPEQQEELQRLMAGEEMTMPPKGGIDFPSLPPLRNSTKPVNAAAPAQVQLPTKQPELPPVAPNGTANLSDEQKQQVYESLVAKFDKTNRDADDAHNKAQADIDDKGMWNNLFKSVSMAANANSTARGNAGPDMSVFNSIDKGLDNKRGMAASERKKAIEDYLLRDKLGQEDKGRVAADKKDKEMTDPNSAVSQRARALSKKMNPSANVDGMSAAQLADTLGYDREIFRIEESAAQRREARMAAQNQTQLIRDLKQQEKDEERTVEGYGVARTSKDAQDLRQAALDTKSAVDDLKSVKEMGKGVTVFDRERVNKIDQLLNQAVGKLRLSMTGPGAMTEAERQMIRESIGDPTTLFSTESIQNAKLDQLITNLEKRVEDEAKMRVKGYKPQEQKSDKQEQQKPSWAK